MTNDSGGQGAELDGGPVDWSALMARAQKGDAAAYRSLLLAVTPYLRAVASRACRNRADAEDIVQDILFTVHAVRHTYDPSRPFKPWLAGIAKHRIADRLRQLGRAAARETSLEPEHETFPAAAANSEEMSLDAGTLRAAMEALPAGQRRAVTLLKLQEMSLNEAAAASGMSVPNLKVATHRGIKALRRLLWP